MANILADPIEVITNNNNKKNTIIINYNNIP